MTIKPAVGSHGETKVLITSPQRQ